MQRAEVIKQLKDYIVRQVLDGRGIGLDETTPLLEWGVINSLEIVRLLNFIQKQFDVEVPGSKIVAEHFTNLISITDMVLEIAQEG
jgi:acyl carrier protein